MPEEWFDLVTLFWSDETILNGRKAGGEIVKKVLTPEQLNRIEALQFKHDTAMQRLLKEFADSEDC